MEEPLLQRPHQRKVLVILSRLSSRSQQSPPTKRVESGTGSELLRMLAFLLMILCVVRADYGRTTNSTSPILVELFTSEGCSSCPPADLLLQQLDASQPFPSLQLIVLSEHVDYWDHEGWKDPYSSSLLTERQSGYVRALGQKNPYTPQIIVDGIIELRASGPEEMNRILQKAAAAPKISMRIRSLSIEGNSPMLLRARIEADGGSEKHKADIYVAVALDHTESQVLHGENTGQHLRHVAVVQDLSKIGKLEKQTSFGQDFQVKLKPGTDPRNIRIVAFVQESGFGKVLGVAMQKISN
jgi:hypothetical protein